MNCKEVREFIVSTYSDEKIFEEKTHDINAHIQGCRECAELYEKIQSVKRYSEKFRKIMPSESVWENIKKEIMKEKTHAYLDFLRLPPLKFAIPAAIFLIILAIFVFSRSYVKHDNSIAEFVSNQAEFILSLEIGETGVYEPLSEEEQ
jgi:predicted anti-sigma-YlaC factor YlaD